MRLLADENVLLPVVHELKADGHNLQWIGNEEPSGNRMMLQRTYDKERFLMIENFS